MSDESIRVDLSALEEFSDQLSILPMRIEAAVESFENEVRNRIVRIEHRAQEREEEFRLAERNSSDDEDGDNYSELEEAKSAHLRAQELSESVDEAWRAYLRARGDLNEAKTLIHKNSINRLAATIAAIGAYKMVTTGESQIDRSNSRVTPVTIQSPKRSSGHSLAGVSQVSDAPSQSGFSISLSEEFRKELLELQSLKEVKNLVGRFRVLGSPTKSSLPNSSTTETISLKQGNLDISDLFYRSWSRFESISEDKRDAIRDLTGLLYKRVNQSLAGGDPDSVAQRTADAVREAAIDLPTGLVLSRKIDYPGSLDELLVLKGKVVRHLGVVSTSIDPTKRSGNLHMKIITAPGCKGLYVGPDKWGAMPISVVPDEVEVMLPADPVFYVTKVTMAPDAAKDDVSGSWADRSHALLEVVLLPSLR